MNLLMTRRVSTSGILLCSALLQLALLFSTEDSLADTMAKRVDGLPLAWPDSLEKSLHTPAMQARKKRSAQLRYAAADDAQAIREWLRSEGYLDAVVTPLIGQAGDVRWRVDAGQRWSIGEVLVDPAAPAQASLPVNGGWFRSEDYESAKTSLRGAWADAGYLQANFVEAAVYPDHTHKTVRIVWRIEPGPLYRISSVEVRNARQYRPELAGRLSLLEQGDVASSEKIRAAIRHISNDSHYRSASVLPVLPEAVSGTVPMRVDVVEADRYDLSGTAGYSTDSGPEAGAAWTDRGMAGGLFEYGVQGSLSRTGGGAGLSLARPVWPGNRDKTGLSLNLLREDTAGQRFNTISGGPFWLHQFDERQNLRVEVRQNWITGGTERIRTIDPAFTLHLDTRDGAGIPHSGWKGILSMNFPWQTNGNGRWFITRMDARAFHSPGRRLMLSPRIGYGRSVALTGTVPKSMRQYAGGAATVRGYKLDSLGPVGADALAQGGLQSANAGLDVVWTLNDRFSPVAFADVGKVWSTPQSREKSVWSYGFGLVAHTPAGPVRADIAFPKVRRIQDTPFQLYIGLGEVF